MTHFRHLFNIYRKPCLVALPSFVLFLLSLSGILPIDFLSDFLGVPPIKKIWAEFTVSNRAAKKYMATRNYVSILHRKEDVS